MQLEVEERIGAEMRERAAEVKAAQDAAAATLRAAAPRAG